jgi:hypothetical protein
MAVIMGITVFCDVRYHQGKKVKMEAEVSF